MRFAWTALALSLAANAAQMDGYLLLKGVNTTARSTDANPRALFVTNDDTGELALGLEGRYNNIKWRSRVSNAAGDNKVELQELHYDTRLGDLWHLAIGQQLLTWDNGLSYQPLGFFKSSKTDLSDVFDTEGRSRGLPMVVLTRLADRVTTDIVATAPNPSSNATERRNAEQVAVRFSGEPVAGFNSALVVRKRLDAPAGFGISTSYAIGETTLHADAYYGVPESHAFPWYLTTTPPTLMTTPERTVRNNEPAGLRSVVGAVWTPNRQTVLYAEWVHHEDGLSRAQWSAYLNQLPVHTQALDGPQYRTAIANLSQDLRMLSSNSAGVRKDYLYLRAELGPALSNWSLSSYIGLADGSSMSSVNKLWKLAPHTSLRLEMDFYNGSRGSEFGLVPYDRQAMLVLIYNLD